MFSFLNTFLFCIKLYIMPLYLDEFLYLNKMHLFKKRIYFILGFTESDWMFRRQSHHCMTSLESSNVDCDDNSSCCMTSLCCRDDGQTSIPISLPAGAPFILLKVTSLHDDHEKLISFDNSSIFLYTRLIMLSTHQTTITRDISVVNNMYSRIYCQC